MTTAYFSKIENVILSNLSKTKRNLQIAVAWFTNPKLSNLAQELHKKGIKVEIILSDDIINFKNKKINFQEMIDSGIEVKITRFPNLMHNKFCIIDSRLVLSGSYNWTLTAEKNNFENIILSNDLNIVSLFKDEFVNISHKAENLLEINTEKMNSYMKEVEEKEEIKLLTSFQTSIETNNEFLLENNADKELDNEEKEQFYKAEILYLRGKHQEAIDLCLELLKSNKDIPQFYELIAASKWRQGKYKEQVEYAHKAVELDNLYYPAYNTLGIGYGNLKNASKSIENYQICITAEPEEYIYYRNRAISYLELEADSNVPIKLRNQFTQKANSDLEKVIELATKEEITKPHYQLFYSRGIAYLNLNKFYPAKNDFLKAIELYKITTPNEQDSNELKEIKHNLKLIEKITKK
ncbi:phospholipase D-like domain-containing protein [Chryseobacterium sp. TY3]